MIVGNGQAEGVFLSGLEILFDTVFLLCFLSILSVSVEHLLVKTHVNYFGTCFCYLFVYMGVSLCTLVQPGSHYVAQAALQFMDALQPQHLKS